MGHEDVRTTWSSYGHLEYHRQGEIIKALGEEKPEQDDFDDLLIRHSAFKNRK